MQYNGMKATFKSAEQGLIATTNYDNVPHNALIEAKNIRFDEKAWRKVGGLSLVDANAIANANALCVGGHDWWSSKTVQTQVTAWDDGIIYKEVSSNMDSVELVNSLSLSTAPTVFVDGGRELVGNNRKLLIFNEGAVPQVLNANAASTANVANLSVDWANASTYPAGAIIHDSRVVSWRGDNLYFSALDDHENFKSYNPSDATADPLPSFSIAAGQADEIRAAHSMGTTRLYVFKYPYGIYFLDTSAVTSYLVPITTVRDDMGIAGPEAITRVGSLGTWFIGSDAHIYSLDLIQNPDTDLQDASITSRLYYDQYILDNINLNRLKWAKLVWNSKRKELLAIYTKAGTTSNNLILCIDLRDPNNPKISTDERGTYFNSVWPTRNITTQEQGLYCSGTGGLVYKMDQDARVIGSATAYQGKLRTPDTDFEWLSPELIDMQKRFDWFEIYYTTTSNYTLYIDVFINGQLYQTYNFTQAASGSFLNTGTLGSFVLGGIELKRKKFKIGGIGTKFSFQLRNSAVNDDFYVNKAVVHFQPLGTKGERS